MLCMSQQGFTIVSLQAGIDVGDIEYIEGKVVAGDYWQVSGDINALNDTIEFIVPNGKTAFIIEAKITMTTNPQAPGVALSPTQTTMDQIVASLKIDSVEKSKAHIGGSARAGGSSTNIDHASGSGFGFSSDGKFNVLGLSLVGNGVKVIEIENVLNNGSGFAEMSGYVINT